MEPTFEKKKYQKTKFNMETIYKKAERNFTLNKYKSGAKINN